MRTLTVEKHDRMDRRRFVALAEQGYEEGSNLVINLGAARAIGPAIPPSVLVRADEVIA